MIHMTSDEIIQAIADGEFDRTLATLAAAVRGRQDKVLRDRHNLGSGNATADDAGIDVGDRVKIGPNIRPKYMVGVEARVVTVNPVKVKIVLDEDQGRFSAGEALTVHPRALVKI